MFGNFIIVRRSVLVKDKIRDQPAKKAGVRPHLPFPCAIAQPTKSASSYCLLGTHDTTGCERLDAVGIDNLYVVCLLTGTNRQWLNIGL